MSTKWVPGQRGGHVGLLIWLRRDTSFEPQIPGIAISPASTGPATGTLDKTLGALTSTAAMAVDVDGTLSRDLDALTLDSEATVEDPVAEGALAVTFGSLTLAAEGGFDIEGSTAATLGVLALSSAASLPVEATLSKSLEALSLSSAGAIHIESGLSGQLSDLTLVSTGEIVVAGTASLTLALLTLSAQDEAPTSGSGWWHRSRVRGRYRQHP